MTILTLIMQQNLLTAETCLFIPKLRYISNKIIHFQYLKFIQLVFNYLVTKKNLHHIPAVLMYQKTCLSLFCHKCRQGQLLECTESEIFLVLFSTIFL